MANNKIMVDSNVLLDVITDDAKWGSWSKSALERLGSNHTLIINPLIYAELSVGFASVEALEDAVPEEYFERHALPYEAAFLAGKCFLRYRKHGGTKRSPLPDFYIGAHAAIGGYRLLTRDRTIYRTYFPKLELVTP